MQIFQGITFFFGYDLNEDRIIIAPVSLNQLSMSLTFVLIIDHNIYIAVDSIPRFKKESLNCMKSADVGSFLDISRAVDISRDKDRQLKTIKAGGRTCECLVSNK